MNPEIIVSKFPQKYSSLIILRNVSWAANQHIRTISERSCHTEDWNNGFWKFSFSITRINYILKYLNRKVFQDNNIPQYYWFYCTFIKYKCIHGEHKRLLSKTLKKNLTITKLLRRGPTYIYKNVFLNCHFWLYGLINTFNCHLVYLSTYNFQQYVDMHHKKVLLCLAYQMTNQHFKHFWNVLSNSTVLPYS